MAFKDILKKFFSKRGKDEQPISNLESDKLKDISISTKSDDSSNRSNEKEDKLTDKMIEEETAKYSDLINQMIEDLRKYGTENFRFGELKLAEIKIEAEKRVQEQIRNNSQKDIKRVLDYLANVQKGLFDQCRTIYELDKRLDMEYKIFLFNLDMGHPFDSKSEIEKRLKEMETLGYGPIKIEEFRKEVEQKLDFNNTSDNKRRYSVIKNYFFDKKQEVEESNKLKEKTIKKISDSSPDEISSLFNHIYGEENYEKRVKANIGIIKQRFDYNNGYDNWNDFINYIIKYLQTFGYDKDIIMKYLSQQQKKNTNNILSVAFQMADANNTILRILMQHLKYINGVAKVYYEKNNGDGISLIKEILSKYGIERDNLYAEIDKKLFDDQKRKLGILDNETLEDEMDIIEFDDDEYYNDYLRKKVEKINANLSKQISLNSRSFSNWMSIVASSDILDDESKKVI